MTNKPTTRDITALVRQGTYDNEWSSTLPSHVSLKSFKESVVRALKRTPKLAECEPSSFFTAAYDCAQVGLVPDGRLAHLIPFKNKNRDVLEATLIIDYKGLINIALRSGLVSAIHADVVCEDDVFVYNLGEITTHTIDFRNPRGEMFAVYARAIMKDGTNCCCVMSKEEIDAIRARAPGKNQEPWRVFYNEMAKKTAVRRLFKYLPSSPEYRDVLEVMDKHEGYQQARNVTSEVVVQGPAEGAPAILGDPLALSAGEDN